MKTGFHFHLRPGRLALALALLSTINQPLLTFGQGSTFAYQGRLADNGNPANGTYDLTFSLFDADTGNGQLGAALTNSTVAVTSGVFTVTLDFGPGSFPGADRWLELGVRTNGADAFTTLSPRQRLTPSPYAITAGNLSGVVQSAGVSGAYSNAVTFSNPANSFAGDGSGLTGLNATSISSGILPVTQGGTGAATASSARANLGAAASGANSDLTSLSGLTTPLSVAQGGTGAGAPGDALANLGAGSLTTSNNFSGVNVLTNTANTFAGDGSGLTGLNATSISSGILPVTQGGTGAATASAARANLGAAASGANSDLTSLSGLTTPLSVAQGGTGAGAPGDALASLGAGSLTTSNNFSGVNILTNPANTFAGDGSGLTGLNATSISSGILPVAQGGTAAATASAARANLGAAANGANSDLTSLSGLTTPLSVAQGGTGAGAPGDALANLGAGSLTTSNNFSGVNVLTNTANTFAGAFAGDGSSLTGLNAANLAAGTLPSAQLSGLYSAALTFNNPADSFVGLFAGNGYGLTNLNADSLNGFSSQNFWQLGGNAGTSVGVNFLGTTDGQALELKSAGGVGINTNNPAGKALAVNGPVGVTSTNTLEFGSDVAGKHQNAGKIGYQTFTPGALDIVGAGVNATSRRIKFWAEGGATFNGAGTNALLTVANTVDESTSLTLAAPFSTWQVGQNKPPDAPTAFDCLFFYQQTAGLTRLLITSDGKVGIGTNTPIHALDMASGAFCSVGGVWTSVSDRNAKQDFTPIQPREVLAKVAALPITQWKYKAEPQGVRHLGPMAQDFHAAFSLGDSDKTIGTVDADGVALAAIQGLNELVRQQDAQIQALRLQNQQIELRVKALESRVAPPPSVPSADNL